jgi:hypothetical protein
LLVVSGGCDNPSGPSLPFRELPALGGLFTCEPGVRVVRNAGEWTELLAGFPGVQPSAIDFTTEMVVIVSLGSRPTSGYSVEIENVRARLNRLAIEAVEVTPGKCLVAQVVTCPGAIVVAPRAAEGVETDWAAPRPRSTCS